MAEPLRQAVKKSSNQDQCGRDQNPRIVEQGLGLDSQLNLARPKTCKTQQFITAGREADDEAAAHGGWFLPICERPCIKSA